MDREHTTSSAGTTETTMKITIMDTPAIMVSRWTDQEEASAHHLTVDTARLHNTPCSTESKARDHQEAVVPHREDQQEVATQEISEAHLKSMKEVHLSGEREVAP